MALAGTSPEELARALRAMAAELERNPTLARRIAEAMGGLPPTSPPTPPPTPPLKREGRAVGKGEMQPGESARDATPPKRTSRAFRPRVVEGASPELGMGIPDPFALRARLGAVGLRAALGELRLGTLRAIAREHGLDPAGMALRGNDAEKLRTLILERIGSGL